MTFKSFFMILVLCLLLSSISVTQAREVQSDVRVLIDVSGSMKHNDPANLRAPALRMLVGLMPETADAGVWTFAKMVNLLVPWQPVSDDWRQNAIEQSDKIHSVGLFTDIEQVLNIATANFNNQPVSARRSLILLSDGFVDLQAGKTATAASRQRVLDSVVARLKKANITVHTIALSEQADHELLKKLALATDGWYEQADSAEQLQRIFLRMFEKATDRDTVPLNDNQFVIDDSVKEMTVLAFRQTTSASTRLLMPNGEALVAETVSDELKWQHEAGYDLITLQKPAAGEWQIDAELDPDNRVMIVTDMQMETTTLPNNVLAGESFDLEARLLEKGNVIERDDFLQLVDAQLARERQGETQQASFVRQHQQPAFKATIHDTLKPGDNDVVVTMHSATFERQRRQTINVVASPLTVEISALADSTTSHRIDVKANPEFLLPASLSITALLRDEAGNEWPYTLFKSADNDWQLTLTDLDPKQTYQLSLQVKGQTPEGREVFIQQTDLALSNPANTVKASVATSTKAFTNDNTASASLFNRITQWRWTEMHTLIFGNMLILLLLVTGLVWWRKQNQRAVKLAGELG